MIETGNIEALNKNAKHIANNLGEFLVEGFHYLTLFAIGAIIVWSAVFEFIGMINDGHISIEDILLLFIYLELLSMVGIYFKTNHMPVRFLIYVAITALTRMLIGNIQHDHDPDIGIIYISAAIAILALSILIIRYGSHKFPYGETSNNLPS